MEEWFEDEEFWRIFGDCMFDESRFRAAQEQVAPILELAAVPVSRVLDLGCGPGRHCLPMAQAGLAVTAVDRTGHFLEEGRRRAAEAGLTVEFQQADMREFSRPGHFDLVVSMWTSFGYFDDPGDDARVLARCIDNLRPGGVLILDIVGKEIVCRDIEPVMATELEGGGLLVERPTLEDDMSRYANQWLLLRDGRVQQAHWHHNLYSGVELRRLLETAGFSDVELHGDLSGAPYDLEAERLIAVARRPDE